MYDDDSRGVIHNVLVQKQKIPSSLITLFCSIFSFLSHNHYSIYGQHGQQSLFFTSKGRNVY